MMIQMSATELDLLKLNTRMSGVLYVERDGVTQKSFVNSRIQTGSKFLAHLSQRLIGELIGYPWSGVQRPSVQNSKCLLL